MVKQYRGLVLTQPWASAVAAGVKQNETRSWPIPKLWLHDGYEVLIYAAANIGAADKAWMREQFASDTAFTRALEDGGVITSFGATAGFIASTRFSSLGNLPMGKVVAVASVKECHKVLRSLHRTPHLAGPWYDTPSDKYPKKGYATEWLTDAEYALGNYDKGRYVWKLENIRPLSVPVPAKGFQRLFTPDPATLEKVLAQLKKDEENK